MGRRTNIETKKLIPKDGLPLWRTVPLKVLSGMVTDAYFQYLEAKWQLDKRDKMATYNIMVSTYNTRAGGKFFKHASILRREDLQ